MTRTLLDPALAGIVRAIRGHIGGMVVILDAESTPWASLTFSGARHRIALRLETPARAARLAVTLPEHEFVLPGHFVADIGEIVVDDDRIRFAALVLEEET